MDKQIRFYFDQKFAQAKIDVVNIYNFTVVNLGTVFKLLNNIHVSTFNSI